MGGGSTVSDSSTLSGRLTGWPAFVRELDATLSVHSQYVLSGNLYDSFLLPGETPTAPARLLPLHDLLWEALRGSGYGCLLVYDPVDGLRVFPEDDEDATAVATRLLGKLPDKPSLEALAKLMSALARPEEPVRAVFVVDYASRIAASP